MPIRVGGANSRGRQGIGIESQLVQRRGIPSCAQSAKSRPILPEPPAPAAQPDHGGARHGMRIIARTGDNRNRHHPGNGTPVAPAMKLRQIVRAHQPDKAKSRIAAPQLRQRVDRKSRAHIGLDRTDPDRRPPRHHFGSGHACRQPGHPLHRFQHIAGRHQPPHFIQPQRCQRVQADAAVRAMRRVEAAAEQTDGARDGQGLIWPVPRTSHL